MRLLRGLAFVLSFVPVYCSIRWTGCHFVETVYRTRPTIFHLDQNQTVLTVRALYPFSNRSEVSTSAALSVGVIHRLADTLLVPVPLLVQCPQSARLYSPVDCELTMIDTRVSHIADHLLGHEQFIRTRSLLCSRQRALPRLGTFHQSMYIRRLKSDLEK